MNSTQSYTVTRTYSEISGFQKYAEDSYSLSQDGELIIAEYRSISEGSEESERISITGISFEKCKKLLQFMSENAMRRGEWIEYIDDYCFEISAKIMVLS